MSEFNFDKIATRGGVAVVIGDRYGGKTLLMKQLILYIAEHGVGEQPHITRPGSKGAIMPFCIHVHALAAAREQYSKAPVDKDDIDVRRYVNYLWSRICPKRIVELKGKYRNSLNIIEDLDEHISGPHGEKDMVYGMRSIMVSSRKPKYRTIIFLMAHTVVDIPVEIFNMFDYYVILRGDCRGTDFGRVFSIKECDLITAAINNLQMHEYVIIDKRWKKLYSATDTKDVSSLVNALTNNGGISLSEKDEKLTTREDLEASKYDTKDNIINEYLKNPDLPQAEMARKFGTTNAYVKFVVYEAVNVTHMLPKRKGGYGKKEWKR